MSAFYLHSLIQRIFVVYYIQGIVPSSGTMTVNQTGTALIPMSFLSNKGDKQQTNNYRNEYSIRICFKCNDGKSIILWGYVAEQTQPCMDKWGIGRINRWL